MNTSITSSRNTSSRDAVTIELQNIMLLLDVKPQQELNRPFACWEDMQRWNQERNGQKMPLTEALNQFRSTLEHTHDSMKGIQNHFDSRKAQTERMDSRLATCCLLGIVSASVVLSLLVVMIG
jgi:hypothetical protein